MIQMSYSTTFKLYDREANSWAECPSLGSTVTSFCTLLFLCHLRTVDSTPLFLELTMHLMRLSQLKLNAPQS